MMVTPIALCQLHRGSAPPGRSGGLTNERGAQVIIGDKVPYHKTYLRIHPVQALNGKLYRAALTLLEKLLGTSPWDDAH